MEAEASRLL